MKKQLFILFILLSTLSVAQESRKEKIEQLKIAFITKELDLTTDEAEKFWPVYNEMSDKLRTNRKERKKLNEELKTNFDELSDNDIKTKVNAILDKEIEEAELKKEYNKKIADIIGYKKAVKLLSLEQRFKRELLNRVNQQGPPPKSPK